MTWLLLAPMVLLAIVVLVLPGAGLGYALGLRGVALLMPAAALSSALISGLALIYPRLGLNWSLLSFAVGAGAVLSVIWIVRLLIEHWTGPLRLRLSGLNLRSFGIAAIVWSALIGYAMIRLFRNPASIIQSYDNVFHLNVVQYILDTGQASSLTVGGLTSGGAPPAFYPAGWHGYVSLILGFARLFAPATGIGWAVNAATIAVLICGWALGCLLLTQVLAGGRLSISVVATAVLGSLYAFPWIFLPEGGLYPNLFGNALVPTAVAWLFLLADGSGRPSSRSDGAQLSGDHWGAVAVVALVLMLPGVGFAHPNAVMLIAGAALLIWWGRWLTRSVAGGSIRWRELPVLIVAGIAFSLAWVLLAPARPTPPKPPIGLGPATWALLQGAVSEGGRAAPTITVLVLVGLAVAMHRRDWSVVLPAGFGAVVFLLALGGPTSTISRLAGGLLYNDSERIAAFALLCAVPAMIVAVAVLVDAVARLAERGRTPIPARAFRGAVIGVLALALAVPLQVFSLVPALNQASSRLVVLDADTRRMNRDEYTLLTRLAEFVPRGEKVIADPTTGGGFGYALSGVPLVFPHAFVADNPAMRQIRTSLFTRGALPATCAALDALGAHYFYSPGRSIYHSTEGPDAFPALNEPDLSMLTPVASVGKATLYRFTGCEH